MFPGLIQQHGYDYNAIQVVLDSQNIEISERPRILEQIIKLIGVIETERRARAK
jgi:hypothetical protein